MNAVVRRVSAALIAVLFTSDAVGLAYTRPTSNVPANWSEASDANTIGGTENIAQWWKVFNDPQLDSLIQRAMSGSHDLRIAAARLREARAQRGAAFWNLGPAIDANASFSESRLSKNAQTLPGVEQNIRLYDAGFDAGWEIDIFGGKRSAWEAARADVDASVEDRRDILVSVLAEVARNYVEVRGFQRRLAIAHTNIDTQQAALKLTQERFNGGVSGELDVTQAAGLLAGTQSQLPTLETSLKQAMHRLGVLLGQEPGALIKDLSQVAPIPATPVAVPVGLPSDLLRRRPDVRRAERQLAGASARIGVQTAELFPKFSLFGAAGFQSLSASDWFTNNSRFWSVGPTISWRLLDFGRIRSQIKAANAREEQALAAYEKAVLLSLEDVENALVAYTNEKKRYHSLEEQVNAARRTVELAKNRYTKGVADFLNVLDAQRSLYQAEDSLIQSERTIAVNLITLYKALGGGWN